MHFAARRSGHRGFAVDALIALILFVLIVFALVAPLALLGSADPNPALAAAHEGGMLILPP
jgi:hypothetical protein